MRLFDCGGWVREGVCPYGDWRSSSGESFCEKPVSTAAVTLSKPAKYEKGSEVELEVVGTNAVEERRGCGAASTPLDGLADESVVHCVC